MLEYICCSYIFRSNVSFNFSRINQSETYSIQDCTYYWDCLSDDGHWTWGNVAHSFSSNGVTTSRSSGTGAVCAYSDITLPTNFECEFTWNGGTAYSICVNAGGGGIEKPIGQNQTWYYLRECANASANAQTVNENATSGDVFKIKRDNGILYFYRNNVQVASITPSNPNYDKLELTAFSSNRNSTLKDIKVKPL